MVAQVNKCCKTAAFGSVCKAATDFPHQNAWGQKEINAETQQKQLVWTMTEQLIYQRPFYINTFLHTNTSSWIWKLWKQAWRLRVDQNDLLNTQLFVKQIKKWSRRTSAWGKTRENKDRPTNTHTPSWDMAHVLRQVVCFRVQKRTSVTSILLFCHMVLSNLLKTMDNRNNTYTADLTYPTDMRTAGWIVRV